MKSVSLLLAIIYSLCSSVEAGLYPTQPIAKTVFRAGAWNTITWIDSGDKPRLNELGRIQIELFNETKYLMTLANDVDPLQMLQNVFIPSEIPGTVSKFVLRFKAPPITIYSSDFSITIPSQNKSAYLDDNSCMAQTKSLSGVDNACRPLNSSILSTGNFVSTALPVSDMNDIVTVTMEVKNPSTSASFPEVTTKAGTVGAMANDASGSRRRARKSDLQFNFIFVFFPALFGLTLAL